MMETMSVETNDALPSTKSIETKANPSATESSKIASDIRYHAEYSPHFSPFKFEPEQAYYATAETVRKHMIQRWNQTYCHFHTVDPKQTYYLSMEYLQGRTLTNAIGNLDLQEAYANALNRLGHELEAISEQEKDAALGNGGLGRLASCFLDSMATLNFPAWGYGLRYKYGLFKQRILKEGQEEVAEDWLEKFSPWEIVRYDVTYPVRFFGTVEVSPSGSAKRVYVCKNCGVHGHLARTCNDPIRPRGRLKNTNKVARVMNPTNRMVLLSDGTTIGELSRRAILDVLRDTQDIVTTQESRNSILTYVRRKAA